MKKLLIMSVCFSWLASAVPPKQEMIPVVTFSLNEEIRLIQIPSKNKVKFNDVINQRVCIQHKTKEGKTIYSIVGSKTSQKTVSNILSEVFGTKKIKIQKGVMPIDDYEEMTRPLISKNKVKKAWNKLLDVDIYSWLTSVWEEKIKLHLN